MAKYRLRYFFDPGAGVCLWSANEAAGETYGYSIDASKLPLPENTCRRMLYMCSWYDTSIDWDYPPDPSPWDSEERKRFNNEAQRLLAAVREQFGDEFEIIDESETVDSA